MTLFQDLDPAVPEVVDITINFSVNEKNKLFLLKPL